METKKIEIGSNDIVEIEKLFGPTVFANLRIEADTNRGWVIYREWIESGEWIEWCVIPMQIDSEFSDED